MRQDSPERLVLSIFVVLKKTQVIVAELAVRTGQGREGLTEDAISS